jgi:O-antigen ligase
VFSVDGVARHGAGGLLFHRLRYAHGALALLGPFLSFFLAPQKAPLGRRGWNLAVALQLSLAGYLAFARAATLTTLLLWCAVLLLWVGGRWRWGALLWVVAVAGGLAFQPSWRQRAQAGVENLLSGERALAMSVGLEVARAHPLWGVGFGNHQKAAFATSARTGITEYLSTDSHNLWLTTWAETGLVGLGLLFLSHLFLGRLLWEASSRHVVGRGAFLSWCAFHLLSCVHYLPYHTGVYLSFALVWGLGLHAGVAAAPSTPVEEKAASAT